jgi:cobyric acid synthase
LHNGSTKNCELVLREDRTCNGCGSEGKWSMNGHIFWTYFHGISHKMEFNADYTEAVLLEPKRNPASRIRVQHTGITTDDLVEGMLIYGEERYS